MLKCILRLIKEEKKQKCNVEMSEIKLQDKKNKQKVFKFTWNHKSVVIGQFEFASVVNKHDSRPIPFTKNARPGFFF